MASELGVAYISIVPSTKGMSKSIATDLKKLDPLAAQAGKRMGDSMSEGIGQGLQDAEQGAEKAAQGTVSAFSTVGQRIKAGLGGDFKTAFAGVESDAASSANGVAQEFSSAGDKAADGFSSKLMDGLKGLGGLAGVAGIGAGLVTGIMGGMERERLGGKLAAQLNLAGPDAERAGQVAGSLYAGAWGESMDETHDAVSAVMSSIPGMMDAPAASLEGITAKALDMATAFDLDVNESVGAVGVLLRNGLAKDATAAFDLMVGGMQRVPAGFRDELLPAITEYSQYFGDLGISGEQAMNMLIRGAENGTIGVDKMGDAVKEFQIRSTDMSKATGDAYDTIGLDMQTMTNEILAGGDSAQGALGKIINGLTEIQDPASRAEAAIALFGTPLEDLSVNEIPNFLGMLDPAGDKLDDFAGSSAKLGDTLNNNTATAFESLKRTISTGFVDAIGGAAIAMTSMWSVMEPFARQIAPFAAGIAIVAGAYGAWTLATTIQTAALWGQAAAFVAANAPIIAVVAGLGLLVGAVISAYQNIGWFRDAVNTAWSFIKSVTAALVSWFVGTAFPAIVNAVRVVGNAFSWLNTNVVQPVWNRIRSAISAVANWFTGTIVPNFNKSITVLGKFFDFLYRNFIGPFVFAFRLAIGAVSTWFQNTIVTRFRVAVNVLGNLFKAFKSNVIDPVWNAIRARINLVVTWFRNTLVPIFRAAVQSLQSRFEVFQRGVSAVWDRVKSAGTSAWNAVRTRVFDPMKTGLDRLKKGFEDTQRGISDAWGKLRAAVKTPISFVVTKVINPFLEGYNKINNAWSGSDIDPIPGFRTGGYTGRKGRDEVAGVVHGDEHVIRSESRRDIERTNPGFLERLNRQGASALPSFGHEGHAAHGGMAAGGPGGPGTYLWGALQNAIYSSGVAHVRGSAPGYDIPAAARAWNNMSNLKVRYGSGPNQINVGGGAPAGTWGYAWTDGRIALNPGIPAGMKTGTAAHEIGHVLGLDHAGTNSIMHPMMRGPLWPSGYDRQTIQRIYGGSGKGNPPEGGGGGGLFNWIREKLSPLAKFVEGPLKAFKATTNGNLFAGMAGGIAQKVTDGLMEHAKELLSGGPDASDIEDKVKRGGSLWDDPVGTVHKLPPGASSIYNGTGGNEYFQRVDPNGRGGATYNLYAFDLDDGMRKLRAEEKKREALAYVA